MAWASGLIVDGQFAELDELSLEFGRLQYVWGIGMKGVCIADQFASMEELPSERVDPHEEVQFPEGVLIDEHF